MADFKTADICGASPNLNGVLEKMDSLKNSLSSSLTVDPSALASTLSSKVGELSSSLSGMIPELPSAPDVSLQAELTALSNINLSLPSGLLEYRSKLDSITNQFGDSLTNSGFSLDDLVSQVAPLNIPSVGGLTDAVSGAVSSLTGGVSGAVSDLTGGLSGAVSDLTGGLSGGGSSVDLCSVVPNFKLPDGATEAAEAAAETLMADAPGVAEKVAEVTANADVASVQADLKKVADAISNGTAYTKASTTVEIKTQDVEQAPIKVARVKDNLTTKTEEVGGVTVTVKERPRTIDTSVAKYFDKPVEVTIDRFVSIDALPSGLWKDKLNRAWRFRHRDSPEQSKSYINSMMEAPIELEDGSIFTPLTESGINVLKNFTDTNIILFRPVKVIKIRGMLKDKLRKTGDLAGFPYKKKEGEKAGAFVYLNVNDVFKRGTRDADNFIVLPNKDQFAYVDIKYEMGTTYNANFKDETRESLTT